MVEVGKSKYDGNGRISFIKELADLLRLEKGKDSVKFFVEDGEIIIRKETKLYAGKFDFEGREIKEDLVKYETSAIDSVDMEGIDPENLEEIAYSHYLEDQKSRK